MTTAKDKRLNLGLRESIKELQPVTDIDQSKPLPDEKYYWKICGYCLQHHIAPILRERVKLTFENLYTRLWKEHKIDIQTYPNVITSFGCKLNYENINGNLLHSKNTKCYDYRVKDAVDLSKLFLQVCPTHYYDFDSLDLAPLTNVVIHCSAFSPDIRGAAEKFRDLRNRWVHCQASDWRHFEIERYLSLMEYLVNTLSLSEEDKVRTLLKIKKLMHGGKEVLFGHSADLDLEKQTLQGVLDLPPNVQRLATKQDTHKTPFERREMGYSTTSTKDLKWNAQKERNKGSDIQPVWKKKQNTHKTPLEGRESRRITISTEDLQWNALQERNKGSTELNYPSSADENLQYWYDTYPRLKDACNRFIDLCITEFNTYMDEDSVLDALLKHNVCTEIQRRDIGVESLPSKKIGMILDIVITKDLARYKLFKQILLETDNRDILQRLKEAEDVILRIQGQEWFHHKLEYFSSQTSHFPSNTLQEIAYGRYNVQTELGDVLLIQMVCSFLKYLSHDIFHVWFGYKERKRPVFVVILEKENQNLDELFEKHSPFALTKRLRNTVSEEAKRCLEKEADLQFSFVEHCKLHDTLTQYSEELMNSHSNLLSISASKLKSRELGQTTNVETCIVLYVHVKGIIPIGEHRFPVEVGDFKVDVREAVFKKYSKLSMSSCIISKGNLHGKIGGFVNLPNGNMGCFTCAHLFDYHGIKHDLQDSAAYVYQKIFDCSDPRSEKQLFGKVLKLVYHPCLQSLDNIGVDVALMEITEKLKTPDDGAFQVLPIKESVDLGDCYTGDILISPTEIADMYINKKAKCKIVRYNEVTKRTYIRTGVLNVSGTTCYFFPWWPASERNKCRLFSQIEIYPDLKESFDSNDKSFASEGDSGSLVFLMTEKGDHAWAIGMVVGGNNEVGSAIVTPIWVLLDVFGLPRKLLTFENQRLRKEIKRLTEIAVQHRQLSNMHSHQLVQLKQGIDEILSRLPKP